VIVNGVLIHILGVGLPAALFARAAWPDVGVASGIDRPFIGTPR
jgi:hypothetical protein